MARLQIAGDVGFIAIHTCLAGGPEALGRASGLAAGASKPRTEVLKADLRGEENLGVTLTQGALAGMAHFAGLKAVGGFFEDRLLYRHITVDSCQLLLSVMAGHG